MTNLPDDGTEPDRHGNGTLDRADDEHPGLLSLVVGSVDEPMCIMHPPDVAAPHRSTERIIATGDAFVDLDDYR
ncbi:hypothetical protein J2751_002918 [Halorubrum alkaliphilum]|uniref:DUF7511 domain-containing protein n=1 Tax=Halorubrum alkaliphilum TaxID=261290 RepID=A0A8T4GLJ7_9EURY|nr:hypothetical protein [Halorubrum alkaliphilum]MBP1923872.1 hypothetical protein [Halorubrum alkaliphilum]